MSTEYTQTEKYYPLLKSNRLLSHGGKKCGKLGHKYYKAKEIGLKKTNVGFQAYCALQKSTLTEIEDTLVIAEAWREKERVRGSGGAREQSRVQEDLRGRGIYYVAKVFRFTERTVPGPRSGWPCFVIPIQI